MKSNASNGMYPTLDCFPFLNKFNIKVGTFPVGCMYENGRFYVLLLDGFYRWSNEDGTEVHYMRAQPAVDIWHRYCYEKEYMHILRKDYSNDGTLIDFKEEVIERLKTGSYAISFSISKGCMQDEAGFFLPSEENSMRLKILNEKIDSIKKIINDSHEQNKRHYLH